MCVFVPKERVIYVTRTDGTCMVNPMITKATFAKRSRGILEAVVFLALLGGNAAAAAPPVPCDMRLSVKITPDVWNPSDAEFLSSLLSGNPYYRLPLLRQRSRSLIVLELTGPAPDYLCQNMVEAIRKDGSVQSVHV